jgi:hypothetical protein
VTDFRLDVRKHSDARLKVTWAGFLPYFVNYGNIQKITERLRDALSSVVMDCQSGGANSTGAALKTLAQHGRDLHDELFIDAGASEQSPDVIREYFYRYSDTRVTVSVDETIQIPWGLIYGGDPDQLPLAPATVSAPMYQEFWCLKHKISSVFYRITPERVASAIPANELKLLPVMNQKVFGKVRSLLSVQWEKDWLDWILKTYQPAYSTDDFKTQWKEGVAQIGLLYFYCHADPNSLAFSATDRIEADQLSREFARAAKLIGKRDWSCLLFLNGCSTAAQPPRAEPPGSAFLEAAGQIGICGFIGTEAEVPDIFGLRFSMEFLYSFLRGGVTLEQVMADIRVRHFPLSLLYSVYTYPQVQIAAAGVPYSPIQLPGDNYSFGQIATTS